MKPKVAEERKEYTRAKIDEMENRKTKSMKPEKSRPLPKIIRKHTRTHTHRLAHVHSYHYQE